MHDYNTVGGTTSSFAVCSKAAVLLALVTKRQGGQLLQALLPELLRLASEGPTQADMVHSLFSVACKVNVVLQDQASSTARRD